MIKKKNLPFLVARALEVKNNQNTAILCNQTREARSPSLFMVTQIIVCIPVISHELYISVLSMDVYTICLCNTLCFYKL